MSLEEKLKTRSGCICELCSSTENLSTFEVSPSDGSIDKTIYICEKCKTQLEDMSNLDETHWHCLNDSMWSEVDAVKVVAYRVLKTLKNQELLDMMYLEDDIVAWAQEGLFEEENKAIHRDSNGVILTAGDTVTIVKDLQVKGAGFTAKQGTAVRNISLPFDDEEHIEGRVNGVKIMILTKYLKK
ncbi:MAG: PhnA domain-containing protein, partial [Campylobacterota bacterium]|nr:PhnA domain-containing protein [Campylobacterota bacterium]